MFPIPTFSGAKTVAAFLLLVTAFGGGLLVGKELSTAELLRERLASSVAVANAADAGRKEAQNALDESRRARETAERIAKEARSENLRLRTARANAIAESDSLRDAAAEYQRRRTASCTSGATDGGPAAGVPSGVHDEDRLLRVYGECISAQDSLAADLAQCRSAGLTCERSYAVVISACEGRP